MGLDLESAIFSDHAREQMEFRGISVEEVESALRKPVRTRPVREGRIVIHRVIANGRRYLLRIFIDTDRKPPEIVTLYKTSKLEKYGEQS